MPDPTRCQNGSPAATMLARPIILIGAGRSGSTLFARMLDSHPRVQFLGETDFLLPRLWREAWENRFWLNFPLYTSGRPRSSRGPVPSVDPDTMEVERERVAALLRRLVADILKVRSDVDAWGYKELWNGNEAVARFSWESYESAFPGATWVHLVRHPLDFLVSVARWNAHPLTKKFVVNELTHWAQMLEWNRRRSTAGRFIEIRYEDLIQDPRKTLNPVLSAAGIEWSDECSGALSERFLHSTEASPFRSAPELPRKRLRKIVASIDNLERDLNELGYELPDAFPLEVMDPEIMRKMREYVDLRDPTRTN